MFERPRTRAPGRCWSKATVLLAISGSVTFSAAAESPPPAGGASFTARPDTLFYARVYRNSAGVLSSLSHDHVIRAGAFTASIRFDPSAPGRCAATLRIPVKSLLVDEPSMRRRVGLSTPLDNGDRKSVRINASALPELRSEALAAQSANVDTVSGATYTSNGYAESLQTALDAARNAGAPVIA